LIIKTKITKSIINVEIMYSILGSPIIPSCN
jgi:hypothetical protein